MRSTCLAPLSVRPLWRPSTHDPDKPRAKTFDLLQEVRGHTWRRRPRVLSGRDQGRHVPADDLEGDAGLRDEAVDRATSDVHRPHAGRLGTSDGGPRRRDVRVVPVLLDGLPGRVDLDRGSGSSEIDKDVSDTGHGSLLYLRYRVRRRTARDYDTRTVYEDRAMRVWVIVAMLGCRQTTTCMDLVERRAWAEAAATCEAELALTWNLEAGVQALRANVYLGTHDGVDRIAPALLGGPRDADARTWLGVAARARRRCGRARAQLEQALAAHERLGAHAAVARDAHQLAGIDFELGAYARAGALIARSREAAQRAGDLAMLVYAGVAEADLLCAVGDHHAAQRALDAVIPLIAPGGDRVVPRLKQAVLFIDEDHPELARLPLEQALHEELAARSPRPSLLVAIYFNLAYVARRAGALGVALARLEDARALEGSGFAYHLNRGQVLEDLGDLAAAEAELARAADAAPEAQWAMWVPYRRAIIAARRGDREAAMRFDREAIDRVADLARGSGSLGPTLIATHREPHLHLIGLLADHERWRDALAVVARLDAQALLASSEGSRELAPGQPAPPSSCDEAMATTPRASEEPDVGGIVAAWRSRRLVVLVPGGARLWRLDVHRGTVTGADVGDAEALAGLARTLASRPDDAAAAAVLEAAFVPRDLAPDERLHVLAIGAVARAPLAALRSTATLVRVPGVRPRASASTVAGTPIVIGDPRGDLPASAEEARRVAARLGVSPHVGGAASRGLVRGAGRASLLHVAARTTMPLDGAALELADGPLAAAELATLPSAPRVVVLASCGAATGRDDAGNGSMVAAFLDAGTEVVVGTRWSVPDDDAATAIEAFYAAGGATDQVGALQRARDVLASKVSARTWASLEITVARPAPSLNEP
ncbi:MAG: CHAT domain-containing protein [Deltaproteobacteria bacterium]|nr:CHAT domain-containing protein [Deltaproteobacteria bacterium]